MRKTVTGILITICLLQSPAFAMGSGNKYQDAQTGVSYQIFQPNVKMGAKVPYTAFRVFCFVISVVAIVTQLRAIYA